MGTSCNKLNKDQRYSEQLIQKTNKNNSDNYKEYFKLVNMKLRRYYEENKNNQINISICLEKKDFNTVITTKKIICDPSQRYIHWKKYLLDYLNKQTQKGCLWSNELFVVIDSELFLSENKWLSLFFWQEYEMRTKPKCLDISKLRKTMETQDYDIENNNLSISDKLNGSFCSINTDTLSLTDPTHEYKEFRNKVKAYMEIFKEHVFDPDHPINLVANYFKIRFSSYLSERIKELYSLKNEDLPEFNKICNMKTNIVTKELQKFIIKLQTCLRLMYSRTINYQYFIEEKDEVINLITNLMFKDGIIYSKLYELYEISLYDEIKVFESKLNQFKGLKPEDLGINKKFCLNSETLLLQKKMVQDKINKSNKKKEINPEEIGKGQGKRESPKLKKLEELNFYISENNVSKPLMDNNIDNEEINFKGISNLENFDINPFNTQEIISKSCTDNNLKNNENKKDSLSVNKNILENIDQKLKYIGTDNNGFEFYPSPNSECTIKLNINESLPNHFNNRESISDEYNLNRNPKYSENFEIDNPPFIKKEINFSITNLENKNNSNSKDIFFDNINVNCTTEDIQTQIKQNKNNLKVISETDLMTKSLKKARNKFIHNYSSYEQAIKMLKSINRYRVPFEKMILIATLASEITECVNEFWKDFENIITSSLLNIDADELMTIFIFVVIKSHMPDLLIHSKIIKEFTTSNSRSTMIGYYFTTLEASIIYILSTKDKESLRSKDGNLFNSLIPNKLSFTKADDQ